MLFGRAQIQTTECSETILKLIPDICKSINANLKHINETSYYIYAKIEEPDETLFQWAFHMLLKRDKKDTKIDLFIEFEGVFEPSKKFIQSLLDALEKKIPMKNKILPSSWRVYEIEKTENGLIKRDGNIVEKTWSLKIKPLNLFSNIGMK